MPRQTFGQSFGDVKLIMVYFVEGKEKRSLNKIRFINPFYYEYAALSLT